MTVKLYYFPLRGRAEVAKLMMAYAKEPFEVIEHSYEEQKSNLDAYPFGQCPRLVDGDVDLVQSNAIIRHLARKHKLYGKTDAEAAQVDMILDGVEDLRLKYVPLIYQDKLEEPAKSTYWKTHGDPATATGARNGGAHFEYLSRLLKRAAAAAADESGSGWLVGGAVTAADIAVYDIVHLHARPMLFPEQMRASYPELMAHHDRVEALPGIKEYLAGPLRLAKINNSALG